MRASFKTRPSLLTKALTAVSIAALSVSFTGCRAADSRRDAPAPTAAPTAAPTVPETKEILPSDPAVPLTMDKVLELAKKGEDLSWNDLDGYAHTDVGSGLYILHFRIDDQFSLLMGGAGPDSKPLYVRLESVQDPDLYIDIREADVQDFIDRATAGKDPGAGGTGKTSSKTDRTDPGTAAADPRTERTREYVDIAAHSKELHEDYMLIRSDADDYPGAFVVTGAQEAAGTDVLQEGVPIRIRMEDLQKEDLQGLSCYRAEQILVLEDENGADDNAREDILLLSAPVLHLSDMLSSTLDSFEVPPGLYSWTVPDGEQGRSTQACGMAPLAAAAMEDVPRLKLPRYNGTDDVLYSFYTQIPPDILTIRQWDGTAAEDPDAKEQVVTTCYQPLPFIDLEAGKIYEVAAEWKKSNADQNGFYGTASYVFVTE